jgi:hypothetical protein
METKFAVELGGNLFLDSTGAIVHSVAPSAQRYKAPEKFHYDAEKVAETLKKFAELLPHSDDDKKAWAEFGVSADLIRAMAKLGKLSSVVAGAATAVAIFGVVASLIGLIDDAHELSPALKRELEAIKAQLEGLEDIQQANDMIRLHAEFGGRIDRARQKLLEFGVHEPSAARRRQLYEDLLAITDELAVPLDEVQNRSWLATHRGEAYKGRAFISRHLFHVTGAGERPVPMAHWANTHFDYRLGVPMLLYGSATFAAVLRVAMPWFRSAGIYSPSLRKLADAIDQFVVRIQAECLSRTRHDAQSVFTHQVSPALPWPPRGHGVVENFYESTGETAYPVGGFDLVHYSDAFLTQQSALYHPFGPDRGRRACFNYTWLPPEGMQALDDIAHAANAQADQDYANLQTATGAFQLIHTAAWLRCLSTPPVQSETVSGKIIDSRTLVSEAATVARSPHFHLAGVVEHPAKLMRYAARSRVSVSTQEPGYSPAFRYRVVVRTLASRTGHDGWAGRDYVGWAWEGKHAETSAGPEVKRLRTTFNKKLVLSEQVLYEGVSPVEPLTLPRGGVGGQLRLRATTFDWYVPVIINELPFVEPDYQLSPQLESTSPPGKPPKSAGLQESPYGLGAVSIHLASRFGGGAPIQTLGLNKSSLVGQVDDFWASDSLAAPDLSALKYAERRHVKEEDVELDWSLSWQDGRMTVQLAGRPHQRPFQVFVVVEETVYSGEPIPEGVANYLGRPELQEQIHTAFAAEIVNQLVMVPPAFFIREHWALEESKELWGIVAREYAKESPMSVSESMTAMLAEVKDQTRRSPNTSTLVDSYRRRLEFAARERPHIWDEVMRGRAARCGDRTTERENDVRAAKAPLKSYA